MVKKTQYVVIGAGSAGLTVAIGLHAAGKQVTIVSENIGGDCTHYGCVPSKTFLHHASLLSALPQSKKAVARENIFITIRKKIAEIIEHDASLIQGIPYIQGTVSFTGARSIAIAHGQTNTTLHFEKAIIATGSKPRMIELPQQIEHKILTNETVFDLKKAPKSITIIGGGAIGCELATAFAKIGTQTTLIVRSRILSNEPEGLTHIIHDSLVRLGVDIRTDTKIEDASPTHVTLSTGDTLPQSDYYLVAAGRIPNTSLALEKARVAYSVHGIHVSSQFQTTNRSVYALGDCIPGPQFTHLANAQGRAVVTQLITPFHAQNTFTIPRVTFTDPPIASTGSLKEIGRIQAFPLDISANDRARITENTALGGVVYADALTGRIHGASLVGDFAEDAINFFTLGIEKKLRLYELLGIVIPYPTHLSNVGTLGIAYLKNLRSNGMRLIRESIQAHMRQITATVFWLLAIFFFIQQFSAVGYDIEALTLKIFDLMQSPSGALLFVVLYILRPLIFFSATVLSFLAGSVFGFVEGFILTVIASNISSAFAYFMGRSVFRDIVKDTKKDLQHKIRENTFETVLIARLVFVPYDLVSYLAGAVSAKFWPFLLATAVGSIAGTIAIVSFGASVGSLSALDTFSLDPKLFALGVTLTIVSLAISRLIKRRNSPTKQAAV